MKTLYLDCSMGAAGDMLSAALLELVPDRKEIMDQLNGLGIPGVRYAAEKSSKCGITGTHMSVTVNGEEESEFHHEHHNHDCHDDHDGHHNHEHHHHTSLSDIRHLVGHMHISDPVKKDILAVYELIAEAESSAHDMPVEEIHFHEVGTMDAVADISAVCLLLEHLSPDQIIASPVCTGSGTVHCAHGILPVPAPATAYLLKGVPMYPGPFESELCTPTGAALLRHFVTEFRSMPAMTVSEIGYGMGKKDFPQANCVRAMLGSAQEKEERILELSCNVDDMTGEEIGFAMEEFLSEGALDAYTEAIGMKKSRPGVKITLMCRPDDRDKMVALLFRNTSTLGVRETDFRRYTLKREVEEETTAYGTVRKKVGTGWGLNKVKYEYEDLARIAREQGISLKMLKERL